LGERFRNMEIGLDALLSRSRQMKLQG